MTEKQKSQFNTMRAALLSLSKDYQTPRQLRKSASQSYGLEYEEALEMSYENMQATAKTAVAGIKKLA